MRNKNLILVEQLDQKLANFQDAASILVPNKGWIHAIRTTLNITMAQLGNKLNITRQGVKRIENSEAKGSISLNSLKEVAEALDLKLVYGFVPKQGSIDNLISEKAENLARRIVMRTHQNMVLEDQAIYGDKIDAAIQELANELKRNMKKSLWD